MVSSSSFPTANASTPKSPLAGPFTVDRISNFLKHRCGSTDPDTSPALWSYEGTLTDPTTGKVVAEVEGLELAKPLPMIEPSQLSNTNDKNTWINKLLAKELLCPPSVPTTSGPSWDAAVTILSRRLFCYRRPSSSPDSYEHPDNVSHPNAETKRMPSYKSLLTSFRLRPDGPIRYLTPIENMAIYDSAVTYVLRNQGREMVLLSEHGGCGRGINENDGANEKNYVMGTAKSNAAGKDCSFDFTVDAQRSTWNDKSNSGRPMLPLLRFSPSNQIGVEEELTISPPRSRFFQLGKGDGAGNSSDRKYRSVSEAYRYSFDQSMEGSADMSGSGAANQSKLGFLESMKKQLTRKTAREELSPSEVPCSVGYTRYGEAPPWYAPGRTCTLELRGKRITLPPSIKVPDGREDSVDHLALSQCLSPLQSWAAGKCNFWSGWPSIFSIHRRDAEHSDLVRQYYQLPPKSEAELIRGALTLFHDEKQLSMGTINDYPAAGRNRWLSYSENTLSKMQLGLKRISKSFIVSESPGKFR